MNKYRILLVSATFVRGGAATGASGLALALKEAGHSVVMVDAKSEIKDRPLIRLARFIERVIERVLIKQTSHFLRLGPYSVDIGKIIQREAPDIIQLCDISGNVVNLKITKSHGVPVVHRLSDMWPYCGYRHYFGNKERGHFMADFLFGKTVLPGVEWPDGMVFPSEWLRDCFKEEGHIAGSYFRVIKNCVANITDEARIFPRSPPRLGFVSGKLNDPRKGLSLLVPHLKELVREFGRAELICFGDGDLSELSELDGLLVDARGKFQKSESRLAYSAIDILLCPSLKDNSPNVVTEAMSHAVPVVGSAGTGIESYVTSSVGGLMNFTDQPVGEFTRIIRHILDNYNLYSRNAKDQASREHSPQVIGAAYTELYNSLISGELRQIP